VKRQVRDAAEALLRAVVDEAVSELKRPVTKAVRKTAREIDRIVRRFNGGLPVLKAAADVFEFSKRAGYEKLVKEHAAQFYEGAKQELGLRAVEVVRKLARPKRKKR
jgi:hypothetical protein